MRTPSVLPLVSLAAACVSEHGPLTNRMSQSATPYLTRAARQPVSWQPWGREAFALAARLDRPILLYVGADDCRWCAVMDREAYGDPVLGAMIDSLFVPVRVDRDERPDVARRYEAALQWLAGLRGYPITVFLAADGSAFFGGTYFPADDPVTGRGLKQILPDVAKSFREQRATVMQRATLVRQLAATRAARAHGLLHAGAVESEIVAVRTALAAAGTEVGSGAFTHTQAVSLLLTTFGRTGDSSYLSVARAVLDFVADSGYRSAPDLARDEPQGPVRAGLLRNLAVGWAFTGERRYREAAASLLQRLARELGGWAERAVFADREAFVIGSVLEAAAGMGDSAAAARAIAALDTLLRRTYSRGRGVRHRAGAGLAAMLQDQVQVAGACLAAYGHTGARRYLTVAQDLASVIDRDFADSVGGGYFDVIAADAPAPVLADRAKPVLDDLLPGANAWAARVLLQLAEATGDTRYRRRAEETLEAFAGAVAGEGARASSYLATAQYVLAAR